MKITRTLSQKRLDIGCPTARQVVQKLFTIAAVLIAVNAKSAIIYDSTNVVVQPFVGSTVSGLEDGQGGNAKLLGVGSICKSGSSFFILDGEHYVRKITVDGLVSTLLGGGLATNGCGTNANFSANNMASDWNGKLHVRGNEIPFDDSFIGIKSIGLNGCVSNVFSTHWSNGLGGFAITPDGAFFTSNPRIIHRHFGNTTEVFAGSTYDLRDGTGTFAAFKRAEHFTSDSIGNIYLFDFPVIRKVTPDRVVTTIAGKTNLIAYVDGPPGTAAIDRCDGLAIDGNNHIYIACGSKVRKVYPDGTIKTIAGNETEGYANGTHSNARFTSAGAIFVDSDGSIYVADGPRIRKITQPYEVSVSPADISLATYPGLTINGIPGRNYRVESSTDFTNWTTAATFTLPTNPHLWIDTNSVSGQKKFYRATLLP